MREPSERYRLAVALLIVIASLSGAGMAWSASVSATRASDLDQQGQQEFLERQQILTSGQADVAEELRRVGAFQQEVQAQRYLEREAARLATRDPSLASQLVAEAQGQAALARNTGALFFANAPTVSPDGTVGYDRRQALDNLLSQFVVYQQLHPAMTQAEAARAHTKTTRTVAVGMVLVGALFFLTLAQVARTRRRHGFLAMGTCSLVAGLVLWILVAVGS